MKTLENVVVLSLEDYEQLMKNQKTEELEVGKWYKSKKMLGLYQGNEKCYGFFDGIYGNYYKMTKDGGKYTKATSDEVEQALIKEAEKRGFKEGVKSICLLGGGEKKFQIGGTMVLNYHTNRLFAYGCCIFSDGKWSEIIPKPKIDYDRLKTGSVVMCKYTGNHYYGDGKVDLNKPLTLVFRKSEFYFGQDNIIKKEVQKNRLYDTFEQDGKFMLNLSDDDEHITEVISY